MPNDFEDLIGELRDAGLDDDYIDRLERATAASPIRKERDQFKAAAEAAAAEAKRYQQVVAGQRFKEFGIKVRPEHLKTPDDLDWADESKVKEWATVAGLLDPPDPNATSPEVDGHSRVVNAAQGAEAVGGRPDLQEALANCRNEAEVMALLRSSGVPTTSDIKE